MIFKDTNQETKNADRFPEDHPYELVKSGSVLQEGAFLFTLPFAIDLEQRLRFDALVVSADIVAVAYAQMVSSVLVRVESEHFNPADVDLRLFQQAWSIVDQCYAIRRLLRSLGIENDRAKAFTDATDDVATFRNRLDHLDQLIPNIAKTKDAARNLFGSVSFMIDAALVGDSENDFHLVMQSAEPIRPAETIGQTRTPEVVRMPVGNFQLSVVGKTIDLDQAILTLCDLVRDINTQVETSVAEQITKAALEQNVPLDQALAHHGARLGVSMALKSGHGELPKHLRITSKE